jgi:hypothetical protein
MTRTTLPLVVLCLLLLSGCALSGEREIPANGSGTDEMKKSPCACLPVPFDGKGYTWSA